MGVCAVSRPTDTAGIASFQAKPSQSFRYPDGYVYTSNGYSYDWRYTIANADNCGANANANANLYPYAYADSHL